jgi:aromatic amino acid aminotransferase I
MLSLHFPGLPSPAYFPFENLKADTLAFDSYATVPGSQKAAEPSSSTTYGKNNLSWLWSLFAPAKPTVPITVPKFPASPTDLNLASALQYSVSKGLPQLEAFIKAFTAAVYRPAYANWAILAHTGNTDGLNKALITLCNPGEGLLMSEWTYPSAISTSHPIGVKPVPVGMDGQGMSATALREVLRGWDVQARGGMPRCVAPCNSFEIESIG